MELICILVFNKDTLVCSVREAGEIFIFAFQVRKRKRRQVTCLKLVAEKQEADPGQYDGFLTSNQVFLLLYQVILQYNSVLYIYSHL